MNTNRSGKKGAIRKRGDVRLVTSSKDSQKLLYKPNFVLQKIFGCN